ncbi:sporulation and spore germination protein [Diaminobutyricimonas aerilata]|uniref:Sporulation and spore germination protein n=1 Tax=Diaminobutyricimonas aerilata TaxID=1162967 RepID=A0A2M9CH62_9MICO|nr:LpqB family beta-propeller domain-containing protein [Diaminobutyricimonas aerilata]PJJ71261.1 sporulation and spore germination protein [Diaminobutyricimonas aerilata]
MTSRMRGVTALAIAALFALVGCAGVPTSGAVSEGEPFDADTAPEFALRPNGPQPDATPEDIVNGFLRAGASPQGGYAIARLFLTDDFRDEWNPNAGVSIRSEARGTTSPDEETVEYSFTTAAAVDDSGRYSEQRTASSTTRVFRLTQDDDGQWRINEAPDGIVVSRDTFTTVFDPYEIWYFEPAFRYLVPELRWFASRANVATAVVAAQLQAPPAWLEGAVVNEFPAGTTIAGGVEIEGGVATVDLSEQAASTSEQQRDRMRQQLLATLRSGFGVGSVVLTADAFPIQVPSDATQAAITQPLVQPAPLIAREGDVGFASGSAVTGLGALGSAIGALGPTAVTLGPGRDGAAVRAPGGVYFVRSGQDPLLVDARDAAIAPSIDPFGFVWSATSTGPPDVRATGADGTQHPIDLRLPPDARLVSLDVSRDGSRLLVYCSTDAGPQLAVVGIVRDEGVPVGVSGIPEQLPVEPGTPIDAEWADGTSVTALSDTASGEVLTLYPIGGPRTRIGGIAGATRVASGNGGASGLFVLVGDEVLQRRGSSWQSVGAASVLGTQQ